MLSTVQYIETRSRQKIGRLVDKGCIERQSMVLCRRMRRRERDAENRVGAETALVRSAIKVAESLIKTLLVIGIDARTALWISPSTWPFAFSTPLPP